MNFALRSTFAAFCSDIPEKVRNRNRFRAWNIFIHSINPSFYDYIIKIVFALANAIALMNSISGGLMSRLII